MYKLWHYVFKHSPLVVGKGTFQSWNMLCFSYLCSLILWFWFISLTTLPHVTYNTKHTNTVCKKYALVFTCWVFAATKLVRRRNERPANIWASAIAEISFAIEYRQFAKALQEMPTRGVIFLVLWNLQILSLDAKAEQMISIRNDHVLTVGE